MLKELDGARRPPEEHGQHTRGHGIERSAVPGAALVQRPAQLGHDVL